MIFEQVTDTQMRAAQIFSGATMADFVAAPMLRGHAQMARMVIASVYIAGILGFVIYVLI